jgi:hypothetical protein
VAGAGPAVVAIHGGPAGLRISESLVPALAESYRVITNSQQPAQSSGSSQSR